MSKMMGWFGIVVAGCIAFSGCENTGLSRARYIDDGEVITGVPEEATVYDLDAAVAQLLAKMRDNKTFQRNYDSVKASITGMPTLVISPFRCNFPISRSERVHLDMILMKASASLYESDLFVIRDAEFSDAIGLDAPDCRLQCYFTRVREKSGCYVYRLHVRLTYLDKAAILWEGVGSVQKVN